MNLSGSECRFALLSSADSNAVNVIGSHSLGTSLSSLKYTDTPNVAYSLAMIIQPGDILTMDMDTGIITGTVAGTNQVETATIVAPSGATTAGNLNVTVTSALVTGSPLLIPVALLLTDNTAALVATKVRVALTATAAIAAIYTVGGTGDNYALTAINKAANDTTLNLAHTNGTSAGITTSATSTNTTPGVGTTRAYKFTGETWDATDFEGQPLPTMSKIHAVLIRSATLTGGLVIESGVPTPCPFISLTASPNGLHPYAGQVITFEASSTPISLTLDIQAGV